MAGLVGKVGTIKVIEDGTVSLTVIRPDMTISGALPLVGTDTKSMVAMLLTAKSTGADIEATVRTVNGVRGWGEISLP